MNLWEEILNKVESKINHHSFNTWFRPTRFIYEANNSVGVLVPNTQFRDWLDKHYIGVIKESLEEIHRPDLEIVFKTTTQSAEQRDSASPFPTNQSFPGSSGPPGSRSQEAPLHSPPALNPKYLFDSYVVGTSNQIV